jgi:chromosome segregation ATPase
MGLFRRKKDPAEAPGGTSSTAWSLTTEIEQLRESLAAMQARLDDVSTQKAALDAEVKELSGRLSTPLASPTPATRPAVDQRDVDILRAQLARIESRLTAVDERVEQQSGWASSMTDHLTLVDDHLRDVGRNVAELDQRVRESDDRGHGLDVRLSSLDERVANVDRRVDVVATELANQLTELGNEVDALAEREPAAPPAPTESQEPAPVAEIDPAVVEGLLEDVRDAQVRLANEQARYQIAFRQDLAELADRLRRPTA